MKTKHTNTKRQRGEILVAYLVAVVLAHLVLAGVAGNEVIGENPIPGPSLKI
jgi:hypothetical protein